MLKAFKKLWNSERGNVLVIAGAALPLLIGSVGLATDTVQWALWKRQLQRAADSGAYAGVYAKFQDGTASTAVTADLTNNNHLWAPLLSGYPQVSEPVDTSTYTHQVQVSLAVQQPLSFSSIFMSVAPTITVTARAAAVDSGQYCVRALYKGSAKPGIIIGGSSESYFGCKAHSNSAHPTDSVKAENAAHFFDSPEVAGAGGMPSAINGADEVSPNYVPLPDPYKDKYSTNVPAGTPCQNLNQHVVSTSGGVTTLSPGCYSGNNSFKFTGGDNYVLQDGTYYLDSIDFDAQGGTVTCSACTIILTGTNPGTVKMNGTATLNLTAPTSGTYSKMLFIQASNAEEFNNNTINGNAFSKFDGAMYFPKGNVNFSGSTGAATKCAMVVGYTVEFSGNANLQNNLDDCDANTTVTGKKIRLIA